MQFPSFDPVFSNQDAIKFIVNTYLSFWCFINHTKDFLISCDKLLESYVGLKTYNITANYCILFDYLDIKLRPRIR